MTAEKWEIDSTHSRIGFSVRHMVVAKVHGQFTKWTGNLTLDTNDLTKSSVDVQIEVGSLDTHEAQRDGHLKSPDFFDAEKFPSIDFKTKRVEKTGADTAKLIGDLTIRGTTKEVTLAVEYGGRAKDPWGSERAGFTATTKIDRRDFDLKWNQVLEAGGVLVGETIDVTLEIEAKKVG